LYTHVLLHQAIACKQKHKLQDAPKILASCSLLGNNYGVGIGLYFQIIAWLRWLLLWLALCMVSALRNCRSVVITPRLPGGRYHAAFSQ
jgi:hypothetical protein